MILAIQIPHRLKPVLLEFDDWHDVRDIACRYNYFYGNPSTDKYWTDFFNGHPIYNDFKWRDNEWVSVTSKMEISVESFESEDEALKHFGTCFLSDDKNSCLIFEDAKSLVAFIEKPVGHQCFKVLKLIEEYLQDALFDKF